MIGFDDAVPSMTELLSGQPAQPQPQQQAPGFLSGAQGWAAQNPGMTNMLLGTMMALAGGHNLGGAVAEGAKMSLVDQASKKAEAEKERLRQEQVAREDAANERKWGYEDRRLGFEEQRLANDASRTASQNAYYAAQTDEAKRATSEKRSNSDLARQGLEKKLAQIDEEIANSKDSRKTAALNRRRLQIQNSIEERYGALEKEADIVGKTIANEGGELQNMVRGQQVGKGVIENEVAGTNARDWAALTPEQRYAALYGGKGGKAPTTPQERLMRYVEKMGENYADLKTGQIDFAALQRDFQQIDAYGTPEQGAAQANRQAAFDAAMAAAAPGSIFTFEGRTFRKPK